LSKHLIFFQRERTRKANDANVRQRDMGRVEDQLLQAYIERTPALQPEAVSQTTQKALMKGFQ
jgi:hypothetical protein